MTAQASGRTDGMGEAREKRIDDLCAERGETVRIDEIAEVVESLLASLDGDFNAFDLRVYREVQKLAEYIHSVKGELADLCPDELKEDFLPAAADELDAIVKRTESATGTILDAAETLEPGFPRWIASLMTFLGGSAIRINAIPSSRRVKPVSPCG